MRKGFFVTGTDTEVGKSWIAAALIERLKAEGLSVGAMKPVAAGALETEQGLRNDDALLLQRHASIPIPYETLNPVVVAPPIAPHIGAREAGLTIGIEPIREAFLSIAKKCDAVVVEGAGGWLVPLDDFHTMADLARRLELPVVLVVGMRLGCINHALLSVAAIAASGLPLAGWVANTLDPAMARLEENIETLESRIDAPLLGRVPFLEQGPDAAAIASCLELPPERPLGRPRWLP